MRRDEIGGSGDQSLDALTDLPSHLRKRMIDALEANLTEAALDRNIELGLLVRDRALAAAVVSQFQGLIDQGWLRLLPS